MRIDLYSVHTEPTISPELLGRLEDSGRIQPAEILIAAKRALQQISGEVNDNKTYTTTVQINGTRIFLAFRFTLIDKHRCSMMVIEARHGKRRGEKRKARMREKKYLKKHRRR